MSTHLVEVVLREYSPGGGGSCVSTHLVEVVVV